MFVANASLKFGYQKSNLKRHVENVCQTNILSLSTSGADRFSRDFHAHQQQKLLETSTVVNNCEARNQQDLRTAGRRWSSQAAPDNCSTPPFPESLAVHKDQKRSETIKFVTDCQGGAERAPQVPLNSDVPEYHLYPVSKGLVPWKPQEASALSLQPQVDLAAIPTSKGETGQTHASNNAKTTESSAIRLKFVISSQGASNSPIQPYPFFSLAPSGACNLQQINSVAPYGRVVFKTAICPSFEQIPQQPIWNWGQTMGNFVQWPAVPLRITIGPGERRQ